MRLLAVAGLVGLAAPLLATTADAAAPASASVTAAKASNARHITIPKSYKYHPHRGPHVGWHDYCTKSPDRLPVKGRKADFRGPCARHDMCIEYKQHSRKTCDSYLLTNLRSECRYTYGKWTLRRGECLATAYVYWKVVRVVG